MSLTSIACRSSKLKVNSAHHAAISVVTIEFVQHLPQKLRDAISHIYSMCYKIQYMLLQLRNGHVHLEVQPFVNGIHPQQHSKNDVDVQNTVVGPLHQIQVTNHFWSTI